MKKSNRLYGIEHRIIAITGGIATGKSTVGEIISQLGLPVISADQKIKEIYQQDQLRLIIKNSYPELIRNNEIVFSEMRKIYFQDLKFKEKLNHYIYPELANKVREFASIYPVGQVLFYEVPLLFEKALQDQVDGVILVYASEKTQRKRIYERDKSDQQTIDMILANQLPIEDKRKLAEYIVENDDSNIDIDSLKSQIQAIIAQITD